MTWSPELNSGWLRKRNWLNRKADLRYLDGKRHKRAVNGRPWLDHNHERLNAIIVFSVADGEIVPNGKERSQEKLIEKIVSMPPEDISGERCPVGHAAAPSRVAYIVSIMKEKIGADNIVTAEIGSAVGAHAGSGTRSIFFMRG